MPWPISTIGMTRVTTFRGSMRTKAFGANADDVAGCANAGRSARGSAKLMTRPPPTAAPAFRNVRRSRLTGRSDISFLLSDRSAMNGGPDPLIGAASADVAGHRGIDVRVIRFRRAGKERRCRHDLPGLAIAALDDLEFQPRLLQRLSGRRLPDCLDGRNGFVADGVDPCHARTRRHAVNVDGARSAQRDAASELGASHAEDVAQHPE